MTVKFKNNAVGYLSAAISSSDSSATLTTGGGAGFPSLGAGEYFYATITASSGVYEVVKVTSRSTDAISITRAQEDTTAIAFPSGSIVELRVTAQGITDAINDGVTAFESGVFTADGSGTSVGLHIGTGKTLNVTDGTLKLPAASNPSQTVDGSVVWDSDDNLLTVGDGVSRKVMVDTASSQTLTNKTLTSPVLTTPVVSSFSNTGTITLPTSSDTLVGRATTDTLTNKTLTSPILTTPVISSIVNSGTLTLPTTTDTLVGRATTDTLTNKTLADAATTGTLTFGAGTTSKAPIKLTSGTNLSVAAAGTAEYDGDVFYATATTGNRGVIATQHFIVLTSSNTLTSQTAAQPIFDGGGGPAGGAITLPVGTFFFECAFALTSMSATSGSFGFALGGTATITQSWVANATKPAALTTATASNTTFNTTANTTLVTANVNTVGVAQIKGVIRVTAAGTVVPQVSLGIAAAAVVGTNSYFEVHQAGNSSVATVGDWS